MIQQSPTERARAFSEFAALCERMEQTADAITTGGSEADGIRNAAFNLRVAAKALASQAAQPAEADGDKLGWHVPENLRWLAEQSDRPGYMPCGALTGVFLKQAADMMEAALATPPAPNDDLRARSEALIAAMGNAVGEHFDSNYISAWTPIISAALKENRRG